MTTEISSVMVEVSDLVRRARQAQETIERYTQQQVDALTTAVGWSVVRQDRVEALAKLAVDEGGFGNYPDKVTKIRNRVMGTLTDIASVKTVGVVEEISEQGLIKIAKPVGVVAALIPTTGPDATPPLKTLLALKGRNAIIIAAHPRTQKTTALAVQYMREACTHIGAPADLVAFDADPRLDLGRSGPNNRPALACQDPRADAPSRLDCGDRRRRHGQSRLQLRDSRLRGRRR